jgi:propanediol dehydratase large subunit
LGENAAAYARGESPEPVVVPQRGEALGARYHGRVALIYAIETSLTTDGATPEEIVLDFLGTAE